MQILIFFAVPSTTTVAFWTLGSQRVRVRRFEWLTLLPDCPVLWHTSHTAMVHLY